MKTSWLLIVTVAVSACKGDFALQDREKVPPAEPPGQEDDDLGDPPDWDNCYQGWQSEYYNLTVDDEFVDPRPADELAPTDPAEVGWWDGIHFAFEKYDATLDFGQNWWPVDEDLEEDPKFFAVYWTAWIRARQGGDVRFSLGSSDDSWVYLNGQPIAEKPGIQDFVRDEYSVYMDAGQYPIEVWYAHRGSVGSGFSFRVLSGDVSICYPDFGTTQTAR